MASTSDIEPGMQTLTLIDDMKEEIGDGAYLALMNALRDDREHWQRATSAPAPQPSMPTPAPQPATSAPAPQSRPLRGAILRELREIKDPRERHVARRVMQAAANTRDARTVVQLFSLPDLRIACHALRLQRSGTKPTLAARLVNRA
jgi:hypothetical protein